MDPFINNSVCEKQNPPLIGLADDTQNLLDDLVLDEQEDELVSNPEADGSSEVDANLPFAEIGNVLDTAIINDIDAFIADSEDEDEDDFIDEASAFIDELSELLDGF